MAPQTHNIYSGNEPYIFISYSHKDSDRVLPIIRGLQAKGFRVWYDSGIEAGTEWPEFIAEKLRASNCVIAFLSPHAASSHNCRREINFAIARNKELLIAYLEDFELSPGMEMQLSLLQAIYRSRSGSDEAFINHLAGARLLSDCLGTAQFTKITEPKPAAAPAAEGV